MKDKYYAVYSDKSNKQSIGAFDSQEELSLFFIGNVKQYDFIHLIKGVELDYDLKLKEKKYSEVREEEPEDEVIEVIPFPQIHKNVN